MINNKGLSFGETVHVNVKVLPKIDDTIIFTKAKKIIDSNEADKFSFEEAMFALNESNFDEDRAIELIKKMRKFSQDKSKVLISTDKE